MVVSQGMKVFCPVDPHLSSRALFSGAIEPSGSDRRVVALGAAPESGFLQKQQ